MKFELDDNLITAGEFYILAGILFLIWFYVYKEQMLSAWWRNNILASAIIFFLYGAYYYYVKYKPKGILQ